MTLTIAAAIVAVALSADAPKFTLDGKQTGVYCRTHKGGAFAALAHDHAVRATEVTGEIDFDPAHPEASKVEVTVKTASLVVDEPEDRKKLGLEGGPGDSDRKKIAENMMDEGQLGVAKFPTIHFVSTAVKPEAEKLRVEGTLTLHGVSRAVSLLVTPATSEGKVVGDGELALKTSDYGIEPYSAGFGAVKNKDQVELILHLVGHK